MDFNHKFLGFLIQGKAEEERTFIPLEVCIDGHITD